MRRDLVGVFAVVLPLIAATAAFGEDWNVPPEKIGEGKPETMMRQYLVHQAEAAGRRWAEHYETLKTPEQIAAYQKALRPKILAAIGGFPERTPLNPQVTGVVQRPGYRIEKILFESRPKFYVSALLFLPAEEKFKPPYPGVAVPCGHSLNGKGYESYQSMGALLALNGMAALVFDPIDQGERGQYLGKDGWPKLSSVAGHTMVGMGCVLLGQNTARIEIWDGMRAIDYLQSRPEVDGKRIGCTGCSGGGTQCSYLMALDDRISAAAPSCYITSMTRLLETIGPQDAEQNIFGQLAFGLDHPDWIMLRAPSPVLLCTATHDFFDIEGAWTSFRYAKRLFTRMGCSHCVDLLEADDKHGYNPIHRTGAARWLSRWLLNKDLGAADPKITLLSQEEYQCTPDGKVMNLPGARSAYDLNEDSENALAKRRAELWATADKASLLSQVRRLTGIRKLADLPQPTVESLGTTTKDGYRVEKLIIRPEEGIALPALWFSPEKTPEKTTSKNVKLVVNQLGKSADAAANGPIEKIVAAGQAVLAVDLRGLGQTQPPVSLSGGYSPEYQDAAMAYLLGRSYVAMRAEDILISARYAAERSGGQVELIATGNVGIPALHAAVLEPAMFSKVKISRMLSSWSAIIHERLSRNQFPNLIHGVLAVYDLPDLAKLNDAVTIEQPVNAMSQ